MTNYGVSGEETPAEAKAAAEAALENFSNRSKGQHGGGFNIFENLHLVGGAISQNICKENDTSWFCQLSRIYGAITMILSILFILFILYLVFTSYFSPIVNMKANKSSRNKKRSTKK